MKEIDETIKQEILYERFKYISVDMLMLSLNEIYQYLIDKYNETKSFYSRQQILKELKNFEEKFLNIYGTFNNDLEKDLNKHANSFTKTEAKNLKLDIVSQKIVKNIFDIKKDTVLGYTLKQMIDSQGSQHYARFKKTFTKLMLSGKRPADFARQLNDVVVGKTSGQVKTIARTYAKHIREGVRDELEQEQGVSGGFIGWVSISTLDSRVSPICISYDQEKYLKKDGFKSRFDIPHLPPRHFNCRSIIVRMTDRTLSYTRASKGDEGGQQVNSKTDFDSFLRRNPETAAKILGRKKAFLFLNNNMKIDRFITDDGQFYTDIEIEAILNK